MAVFMTAWTTGDAITLGPFFSEDAEYRNGPLAPAHGREAIVADLTRIMSLGGEVEADVRHLLSEGEVVMTETGRLGRKAAGLRVAGVFEVQHGAITGWRGYFDPKEFGAQLAID
jgi:limonene-1,2-epoxide hydrolase